MMTPVLVAAAVIICPPAIELKQQMPSPIEGWSTFDTQELHKFYFAQFSDGPPSRAAILMHDKQSRAGKDKVLHYLFLDSQDPWLICAYTGTSIVLSRRLPGPPKACRITLSHAHNDASVTRIECQ